MATHIFVFFLLCKLKILPTLRPCNFKSKSQCCLENNTCKDCDKPCLEIDWESCHCHMLPTVWCQKCCFMQIGTLGICFWSNFSLLPLFHPSLLTILFRCYKVQPRYTFEKCKYLDSPMFMWTTIGRFSEAGLHEWMRFVIFRARRRERSQHTSRPISE